MSSQRDKIREACRKVCEPIDADRELWHEPEGCENCYQEDDTFDVANCEECKHPKLLWDDAPEDHEDEYRWQNFADLLIVNRHTTARELDIFMAEVTPVPPLITPDVGETDLWG